MIFLFQETPWSVSSVSHMVVGAEDNVPAQEIYAYTLLNDRKLAFLLLSSIA